MARVPHGLVPNMSQMARPWSQMVSGSQMALAPKWLGPKYCLGPKWLDTQWSKGPNDPLDPNGWVKKKNLVQIPNLEPGPKSSVSQIGIWEPEWSQTGAQTM